MFFRTVIDDAGRRVPLYIPGPRLLGQCRVPRDDFREMHREVELAAPKRAPFLLVVLLTAALALFAQAVLTGNPYACMAMTVPLALIGAWVVRYRSRLPTRNKEVIVRSLLHRAMCPSCACELAGVRRNPAGLTVCPECQASWRL